MSVVTTLRVSPPHPPETNLLGILKFVLTVVSESKGFFLSHVIASQTSEWLIKTSTTRTNSVICFLHRKLAEEELKTNIAETEVFVLPSGQQIEKEDILL